MERTKHVGIAVRKRYLNACSPLPVPQKRYNFYRHQKNKKRKRAALV